MLYSIVSAILITIAIMIGIGAVWTMIRRSWFMTWIKGSLALAVVAMAVLLVLLAVDLIQFKSFQADVPVAKVKLKRLGEQQFQMLMEIPEEDVQEFVLSGDLWQLDARLITWYGPLAAVGMRPGYRFERVSGRYYSLEQEQKAERTVYAVDHIDTGVDFWEWLLHSDKLPWVKARYGSATFLPMKDGAEFSIAVGVDGLVAKPVNSQAVEAIQDWN
ncbi:hypothetical protein [Hahella ganghwensis]|uniref:hypothetical protein n=1 Tax=Hahella ganghwensis TaxID=286420 RepID=UPI00036C01DC|nr:hypothetical protein [Hahella ganghwensis]